MRLDTERPDDETQVVCVAGDLEGEDAPAFASALAQNGPPPRRRVIDLTETTFIDSAGMSALVQVAVAGSEAGGETVLVLQADSYARRLLEVRGVLDWFRVVATQGEALAV